MIKYIKQKVSMCIKLIKIHKLKKQLDIPMERVHSDGSPFGKKCPRCGYSPCIYDFCLACGQRIYYESAPQSLFDKRFKDVDEMCKKIDELTKCDLDYEQANRQYEKLTGRKLKTLTQERAEVKIEISELLKKGMFAKEITNKDE